MFGIALTSLFVEVYMLPTKYKTGNRKLDSLIAQKLSDTAFQPTKLELLAGNEIVIDGTQNKYHVVKKEDRTYTDGTLFASKLEMERYDYLLKLQTAKEITNLQMQVPFVVWKEFYDEQYGKQMPVTYVADFVYTNISYRKEFAGREIVEDSKSGATRTKEYKIKRKLFLYHYPQYLFFEV